MKSNFKSTFGGELRDNVMQFQLDNEVGSLLKIENDKENGTVEISLLSKNNFDLGHGTIDIAYSDLTSVYLNHSERRLEFTLKDGTKVYCYLDDLYNTLDEEVINRKTLAGHSIVISQDKEHIVDIDLINANGESISHQEINLDNEHIIDKVDLDYENKKLIFTFKDGHKLDCDISDLIDDLNKKIEDEEIRATNKEDEIQSNLDIEAKTRKEDDDTLTSNLNNEIERAINREDELSILINNLDEKQTKDLNQVKSELNTRIDNEVITLNKTIEDIDDKQTRNLNEVKEDLTKKINEDIDALDVAQIGNDGNYIKYVSEENGKVNATTQQFDNEIDENASHNNTPSTLAIYTFVNNIIDSLDVSEVGEDNKYIKFIKEENGKIEATLNSFETLVNNENASTINAPTSKAIKDYVDSLVTSTKEDLTSTIESNYNTLDSKIDTTKSDLQSELKETLKSYYTKVEIDEQENAINNSITTLENQVNQNKTDINNKVDNLNTTLTKKIDDDIASTKDELQANIDNVASDLSIAKESLEAKDKELEENIGNLNTTLRSYVDISISNLDTSLKDKIEETKEELENKINLTYEILN